MTIEKTISAESLMSSLGQILNEIKNDGVVYFVEISPEYTFVLGPERVCSHVLGLVDEEYGWPKLTKVSEISSIDDISPGHRCHPCLYEDTGFVAGAISVEEYEQIKKKLLESARHRTVTD